MSRFARVAALAVALACCVPFAAGAGDAPVLHARTTVTQHTVHLTNGVTLTYTATAGTLLLRNEHNEPAASIFYVAYTTGDRKRPVTFLYNGGPGSASLWLHIGAFGPRRIVTADMTATPPAAVRLADNPATLLDTSDLVFIDAPGTGYSTIGGKGTPAQFYGVDEDLRAFAQFIHRWVIANDRAASPKFLLGESYGTFRSAGLVDHLQKDGMPFNGIILLSSLLDYADDFGQPGQQNLPAAFAVPSEAAVAWYHKQVPVSPPDLATHIEAARAFTSEELIPALLRTTPLDAEAQTKLALRLHALIGLDAGYLTTAHLRVSADRFESELLARTGRIIGRYDGRAVAAKADAKSRTAQFDPSYEAVAPAFNSAFAAYAKSELGWRAEQPYRTLPGEIVADWNFRRAGFYGQVLAPTTLPDLRDALGKNPNLRVFTGSGLFDLATPFYATQYEMANVGLEPAFQSRLTLATYPAGHMIYLTDEALVSLRADLEHFYASALSAGP